MVGEVPGSAEQDTAAYKAGPSKIDGRNLVWDRCCIGFRV